MSFLVLKLWKNNSKIYSFVEEVLVKLFGSAGQTQLWRPWLFFLSQRPPMERAQIATHGTPVPLYSSASGEHMEKAKLSLALGGISVPDLHCSDSAGRSIPVHHFPHLPIQHSAFLEHVSFWWASKPGDMNPFGVSGWKVIGNSSEGKGKLFRSQSPVLLGSVSHTDSFPCGLHPMWLRVWSHLLMSQATVGDS